MDVVREMTSLTLRRFSPTLVLAYLSPHRMSSVKVRITSQYVHRWFVKTRIDHALSPSPAELDEFRHLVVRHPPATVLDDLLLGGCLSFLEDDVHLCELRIPIDEMKEVGVRRSHGDRGCPPGPITRSNVSVRPSMYMPAGRMPTAAAITAA